MLNYNSEISRGGEIGRRGGFKIHCPSGRGGSSPFLGTYRIRSFIHEKLSDLRPLPYTAKNAKWCQIRLFCYFNQKKAPPRQGFRSEKFN